MKKLLAVLGALVLLVPLLAVTVAVFFALPVFVRGLVPLLFLGAGLWWFLRKRGIGVAGSETSLIGRHSAKEGLL